MALILILLLFLLLLFLHHHLIVAGPISVEFLYPNFTASSINYIEKLGFFLTSPSSTFSAVLSSDNPQSSFIFSILHRPTSTVVWSANPSSPAPYTSILSLTISGLSISDGPLIWSTPPLLSHAAALRLLDSGNLLLIGKDNSTLWQSFEHPTDTLLSSQRLPAGAVLSTITDEYRLLVAADDAFLLWVNGDQQYWRLSADPRFNRYRNDGMSSMEVNGSGLLLFSSSDRFPQKLQFIRLESGGRLRILGYSGNGSSLEEEFVAPIGNCNLPLSCKALEICTVQRIGISCKCPMSFSSSSSAGGCAPADRSAIATPSNCASELSYMSLGTGVGYFANKFASPANSSDKISMCRSLCTRNCSCLGFFYKSSSRSCFLVYNQVGSFHRRGSHGDFDSGEGYLKITAQLKTNSSKNPNRIPIILPSVAVFLLAVLFIGIYYLQNKRIDGSNSSSILTKFKLWTSPIHARSSSDECSISNYPDNISIPNHPTRLSYHELVTATNNFSIKIGSGGFGEVFKGHHPDKSAVAVKRINAGIGSIRGKKEFITEINVIGSIHHMNLVRLRGFCAEGRRRLLVYEYMNRGSLEKTLFLAGGPLLEWKDRIDIAVGVARGLAYLHSGCDRKIVHCDVKPENILLHSNGSVKISDFGMAKLMNTDQSGFVTTMRGTRGYIAPEWLTNSSISDKTDVYSYGMVLLEIIRGRKNWSAVAEGWLGGISEVIDAGYFPMFALEMHEKGRYLDLADPRLEGRVTETEVGKAVRVALCCLHEEPGMRPAMDKVEAMLSGAIEVGQPNPEALGFLRVYGRGFLFPGDCVKSTSSGDSAFLYSDLTSQQVSGPR